jgi:hypothetical protein
MKPRIKRLFILYAFINTVSIPYGWGQAVNISGIVSDAETQKGIPNIHIYTGDMKYGTVSSRSGAFSIGMPSKYSGSYLHFSGIGYRPDSMRITNIYSPLSIFLSPETYRLKEVYVLPDSTILTLLRRAYNKIPENYPTVPTMYEGFYRESIQNGDNDRIDFIEASLLLYKDPYDNPTGEPGQIKILQSRKKRIKNIDAVYYGGAFIPVNMDFVLKRADYLQPGHFKNYNYEFNGIRLFGDKECYEIRIKNAKDSSRFQGTVLIEKESLAYVSMESASESSVFEPRVKDRSSMKKVIYEKKEGRWYLKYCMYSGKHTDRMTNEVRYNVLEYLTTNINFSSAKPIPYEQRLAYYDPLILKAQEYDSKGWTDYDIIKNEESGKNYFRFSIDEAAGIFSQNQTVRGNMIKLYPYLLRLHADIGLSYKPVHLNSVHHQLIFRPDASIRPFTVEKNQKEITKLISADMSVGYHLNKTVDIYWQNSYNLLNKESISLGESSFGIDYKKNIISAGRPLFVGASLGIGFRSYYADLGKYDNPSAFTYRNTKIDATKIFFDYGIKQTVLSPQLSITRNMNRLVGIKMYVSYYYPVRSKNVIRIKEEKGFLFSKKTVTLSDDDKAFTFPNNNNSTDMRNSFHLNKWDIGLCVIFH